ncbi:mandelate racemase [Bordetella petrii]|nr:mandelate racemase [Bordetella petrii]
MSAAGGRIVHACVYRVSYPLTEPYRLSSGDLTAFDPILIELRDAECRTGWGEALIIPGYTHESVEGSWQVACMLAERVVERTCAEAASMAGEWLVPNPGVASALLAALDMLRADPLLCANRAVRMPLLAPCQAHVRAAIRDEVDALVGQGFRTLKVKVGYDWKADLERVGWVQDAAAGRATLRLDANRGFTPGDGARFARDLDPRGIELFEQPCGSDDWEGNARVAEVSAVPVMLDESIYGLEEIERAATVANVGFVKLKLKKVGSVAMLRRALERIGELGMTPVLGDGVALELACWMEACVGARAVANAGEMNGFLKVKQSLFTEPLPFRQGAIELPANYWPEIDIAALRRHILHTRLYAARGSMP